MTTEQFTNPKPGDINPKNGKPFYSPFVEEPTDPSVMALLKDSEEKTYYVLYYNLEYEEFKWKSFTGRYNTYFGIKDILDTESIDLHNSVVLVETVALDPTTKKGKRYLNHPDNSANIIDFCHHVEIFFGDNAYSVDSYDTGPHDIDVTESEKGSYSETIPSIPLNQMGIFSTMKEAENGRPVFNPIPNGENIESREI